MAEYITTRTYYSKKLDEQTYSELALIAKRLGILRKIIWHQFSSDPKKLNDRKISEINLYTSAEKVKEILTKRADAVLSASVETAQLGLQQVVPINLELSAKSGLSKKSSKNLAKVS